MCAMDGQERERESEVDQTYEQKDEQQQLGRRSRSAFRFGRVAKRDCRCRKGKTGEQGMSWQISREACLSLWKRKREEAEFSPDDPINAGAERRSLVRQSERRERSFLPLSSRQKWQSADAAGFPSSRSGLQNLGKLIRYRSWNLFGESLNCLLHHRS